MSDYALLPAYRPDDTLEKKSPRARSLSSRFRQPRAQLWYILLLILIFIVINIEWNYTEPNPPPTDPELWQTIKEPKGTGGSKCSRRVHFIS